MEKTEEVADLLPPRPDMSHIVTEDEEPVDNLFSAKQQRLLVEPLYTAWQKERPFLADANVGVFSGIHLPPLVPDMFLSMDVRVGDEDWWLTENRSYFLWVYGKPPEVVVEVVSNRKGGELGRKMRDYARMGVPYYVVYDPEPVSIQSQPLIVYQLVVGEYLPRPDYQLAKLGLSLRLWDGTFENGQAVWLRWADSEGNLIPTGAELSEQARARAEQAEGRAVQAEGRAERMAARLRELGIDPEAV
ncbi:MAG: Uma2 family endonuclease [Chloroflexi bacterium]|nr:MAG: Uma2 family endonuclease [Chloroflexota bacterium]